MKTLSLSSAVAALLLLAACGDQKGNGTMGTAASESERSAISMKLDDAFKAAQGMSEVKVATLRHENGITLSGHVSAAKDRDRADSIVRAVAPGWKVDNRIKVVE